MTETLKLKVKNESRLLKALFEESPKHTYYRELALNSIEASATYLRIEPIKVGRNLKAMYLDDGSGLDEEGLKSLSDLYGSAKGDDHFGTGARVLTLSTNENGVIFQSKVDGVVRYVKYYLSKGNPVFEYTEGLFTEIPNEPTGNYTAVILLGNNSNQNTFKMPYGSITRDYPFEEQLENRFYGKTNTSIIVDGKKINYLEDILKKGEQFVVSSSKFDIIYTIKSSNLSGVVYENELYYPSRGRRKDGIICANANALLGKLDAYSVSESLSVIVKIKKKNVNIKQHRDGILDPETREDLNLEYFLDTIKRHTPLIVKMYISDNRREAFSNMKIKSGLEKFTDFDSIIGEEDSELDKGTGILMPKKKPARPKPCPECGEECGRKKECPKCGYIFPIKKTPIPSDDPIPRNILNPRKQSDEDGTTQKGYAEFNLDLSGTTITFERGEFVVYEGGDVLYFNTGAKAFTNTESKLANKNIARKTTWENLARQVEERIRPVLRGMKDIDRRAAMAVANAVLKDSAKATIAQLDKGV